MKAFLKVLLTFAAILLISAVLSPLLFKILPYKFERIFNRLVMIFTLCAIFFYVRKAKWDFSAYGLKPDQQRMRFFMVAFAAGLGVLAVITGMKLLLGDARFAMADAGLLAAVVRCFKVLMSALVIALIEEIFFRGFIFSTLKDRFAWGFAGSLVVTNLFYSSLHFISEDKPYIGPEPTFFDSFKLMAAPFTSLGSWQTIWPGAVGLFLFGIILTLLFIESKSLYVPMGFHAGCVFYQKMEGLFFFYENQKPMLLGTNKAYDGVLGWGFILLMGWALLRFLKARRPSLALVGMLLLLVPAGSMVMPASVFAEELVWKKKTDDSGSERNESLLRDGGIRSSPLSRVEDDGTGADVTLVKSSDAETGPRTVIQSSGEVLNNSFQTNAGETAGGMPITSRARSSGYETVSSGQETNGSDEDDWLAREERRLRQIRETKASETMPVIQGETLKPAIRSESKTAGGAIVSQGQQAFETVSSIESRGEDGAGMKTDILHAGVMAGTDVPISSQASQTEPEPETVEEKPAPPVAHIPYRRPVIDERETAPENDSKEEGQGMPEAQRVSAVSQAKLPPIDPDAPVYSFYDFLSYAEVRHLEKDKSDRIGKWDRNRFYFPGLGEQFEIRRSSADFDGVAQEGVMLLPQADIVRRLRFRNVPTGDKLVIFYGIEDSAVRKRDRSSTYLRIWIGAHELDRLQVSHTKGWKKKEFDLGIISFLKSPVNVTFDITTDTLEPVPLSIFPELQKSWLQAE